MQGEIRKSAPEKVRDEINKKLRESTLAQWFPGMAMKKANRAYAQALKAINNWQPGASAGRGGRNKMTREIYAQMNKAYNQNYSRSITEMNKAVTGEVGSELNRKLGSKELGQLDMLLSLAQAGGIELPKPIQPLRASHLEELKTLNNISFTN